MKIKSVCFTVIIFVLVISACLRNNKNDVENLPGIDIPKTELNTEIVIEVYPGMPQGFRKDENLILLIKNLSTKTIVFPQDFGVKILVKQDAEWQIIDNNWGYPEGSNILPTNDVDPSGLSLFVFPDMSEISSPTTVRVVVIGQVKEKSEQVGAYVDVQYTP